MMGAIGNSDFDFSPARTLMTSGVAPMWEFKKTIAVLKMVMAKNKRMAEGSVMLCMS